MTCMKGIEKSNVLKTKVVSLYDKTLEMFLCPFIIRILWPAFDKIKQQIHSSITFLVSGNRQGDLFGMFCSCVGLS